MDGNIKAEDIICVLKESLELNKALAEELKECRKEREEFKASTKKEKINLTNSLLAISIVLTMSLIISYTVRDVLITGSYFKEPVDINVSNKSESVQSSTVTTKEKKEKVIKEGGEK